MAIEWKWLRGDLDDPKDADSFAALKITVDDVILTRCYDRIAGGERDTINIPLYSLALFVAENWWNLLYEPRKSYGAEHQIEAARHSIDANMPGYSVPPISLWSAGENEVLVETPNLPERFSALEFLSLGAQNSILSRIDCEQDLFRLVKSVVDRVCRNGSGSELDEAWDRVLSSLANQDEQKYCVAAGKVGINPYDPEAMDLSEISKGISDHLFSDICEAVTADEIEMTTNWAKINGNQIQIFPKFDIAAFGSIPTAAGRQKAWDVGYEAARTLRQRLGLEHLSPRRAVDEIFGEAVRVESKVAVGTRPSALEGIVKRADGSTRVAIPKVPARLRRSILCRGAYRAWTLPHDDFSAVTSATTREQQASRAFAAELLAPAAWLREQAGAGGLTESVVESLATSSICPQQTIYWQARNHGIPIRGLQPLFP
jgi:hypothetical protein